jgi:long-chain fatty acid transport protein
LAANGNTMAAGFALIEQSASQVGNAFAGASAVANDASTIFFNPAGMTRVPHQFVVAGHAVITSAKFDGSGSAPFGIPVATTGGNGGDAGGTGLVPNLYYTVPLNQDTVFGLGVGVPFGLSTEYDNDWVGRYHAVKSEVTTVNINPSIAYKVNEQFSVGAGFSAQYIYAKLTQQVDYGGACVAQEAIAVFPPGTCAAFSLAPQADDGLAKVRGNDWSLGFNFGLLLQATDATRVGFAYRSKIKHQLRGRASFNGAPALFTGLGQFLPANIEAGIDLPKTLSLSIYHDISSKWSVMADATWTGWETFDQLTIKDSDNGATISNTDESWNNNVRYSLGVDYRPNSKWVLRGGLAYDETPIPSADHRTPRIPGEDRIWVSAGFGYRMSEAFTIDAGYAHLFVDDPELSNASLNAGTLSGEYDAAVDIISVQLVWNI